MDLLFQAIFLGLIQGLTEYLPISSTGHVRVSAAFLGIPDPGSAFSAVTQIGTALAVAIYFRNEMLRLALVVTGRSTDAEDKKLLQYMVIATIPIVVIGYTFADFFQQGARDLRLIASVLIIFGILLYLADKFGKNTKDQSQVTLSNAFLIGVAQTMALIPGVSRSGATMTMGRVLGLNRIAAARVSFLLSLPAVMLAAVYEMRFIGDDSNFDWPLTLLASTIAFVTGYLTIGFMLRWLAAHSFTIFAVYRVILGLIVFIAIIYFDLNPLA